MLLQTSTLAALTLFGAAASPAGETVAVRAGTIHLVEGDQVLTGGATILVRDGRIVAVGDDLELPRGTTVVDYGPHAVIVPGFVAPDSGLADGPPSERTAAPELSAIDGFDFYGNYTSALAAGVTSAYVTPARDRLIAGHGAVVSLGPGSPEERVLRDRATVHGAISAEARSTPGYWEPPVPATSDVGIGVPEEQLPRSTMGAVLALRQLLDGVAAGESLASYGPLAVATLTDLLEDGARWRLTAVEEHEVRALVQLARERGLDLIVDGAHHAGALAEDLAEIGASVVYEIPFQPPAGGDDGGQVFVLPDGRVIRIGGGGGSVETGDADMPDLNVPALLAKAGVPVAVAPARGSSLRDLRFAASIAARGGLDLSDALAAITLVPAEIYGVADQVGSLAPGKRADFVVFNGTPLDPGSSVRATWVGGDQAWTTGGGGHGDAHEALTVVSVDELHLGDGRVLEPGEVLFRGHRIVEVGRRVARPAGAVVVRGPAAMPGIVDAGGRLGLDGSSRMPSTDFDLSLIVDPGDELDRTVAKAGVTTVLLDPRGSNNSGAPILAYHPAARDYETLVIDSPAALRLGWTESNRYDSGKNVRKLLEDAVEYRDDWLEYEQELAEYEPEESEPEFRLPEGFLPDEDADEEEEEEDEDEDDDVDEDDPDPDPVTGIWLSQVQVAEDAPTVRTRMQIRLDDGAVEGFLRSALLSSSLLEVSGSWDAEEGALELTGRGEQGPFTLAGKLNDTTIGAEEVRLEGTLTYGDQELAVDIPRVSREYPVAERPARPPVVEDEEAERPDGAPREPRFDGKLEPLKRALEGDAAVVVEVSRADEILECVAAFEAVGIRPILLGASDAAQVADRIAGRVAGVLLDATIVSAGVAEDQGYRVTNRYATLQAAGIPVAFRSDSEAGAAELPLRAAYAVSHGMSPVGALRALTYDAARMFAIDDRVGLLDVGRDADLLLLSGSPLDLTTGIERVWVAGREVR